MQPADRLALKEDEWTVTASPAGVCPKSLEKEKNRSKGRGDLGNKLNTQHAVDEDPEIPLMTPTDVAAPLTP